MTKALLAITEMTVSESLVTAVLGIAVVMAVLALLAGIITVMSKVVSRMAKEEQAPAPAPAPVQAPAAPAKPQGKPIPETQSRGQCDLTTVDDKTAAMLMAIVADQMGEPLNTLRFTSIRPID